MGVQARGLVVSDVKAYVSRHGLGGGISQLAVKDVGSRIGIHVAGSRDVSGT